MNTIDDLCILSEKMAYYAFWFRMIGQRIRPRGSDWFENLKSR